MRVSDSLRDRAERLRALAVRAREDGNVALSDEITRLAAESSNHAEEMDPGRGAAAHSAKGAV